MRWFWFLRRGDEDLFAPDYPWSKPKVWTCPSCKGTESSYHDSGLRALIQIHYMGGEDWSICASNQRGES